MAVRLAKALADALKFKSGEELRIADAEKSELAVKELHRSAEFVAQIERFKLPLPEGYASSLDEANQR